MSLNICLGMESVQHLPVPGKLRVSSGGCSVGGESHREHQQSHRAGDCPCPRGAPEKHKLDGSKFSTFRLRESHQLFYLNIGLAWPGSGGLE